MVNNDKKIAVFIDCENISPKYVQAIFDDLANYGEVIIKKAYIDWSRQKPNGDWRAKVQEFALEPIQVFPNISQKNATDIKIVIDVINTMASSQLNIIALVTSDSDFTDLAKDIKAKGFEALGYGEEKTPKTLRKAYSTFIQIPINDECVLDGEKIDILSLLKEAINTTRGDNEYALISQVGSYLKNKESSLIAKNFGGRTWGDVYKKYPKNFKISHLNDQKSIATVAIK